MKQAPHDLRDYVLGELNAAERAAVELYLATEPTARAEVESLRATCASLREMPAEEPPRRIAFVSDKIFEPSMGARFLRWLRLDGPRVALGASAMLAVVFAGLWATQPRVTVAEDGWTVAFGPAPVPVEAAPAPRALQAGLDEAQVRAIFEDVIAQSEARNREAAAELVRKSSTETRMALTKQIDAAQEDMESGLYIVNRNYEKLYMDLMQSQMAVAR